MKLSTVTERQGRLHTLKKLRGRSTAELRVRGAQALSARAERAGLSSQSRVPEDRAFFRLLSPAHSERTPLTAATLLAHFRERATPRFFAAFDAPAATRAELQRRFGAQARQSLVARAAAIRAGKFDLLGLRELDFGAPIDWLLEPTSGVRAPLAHWSEIDFLDPRVAGDKKFTWELNRHQHFMTLGRAYWQTGDETYAETFAVHAAAWIDANPPKLGVNWASSLEVSFRALSWLWALHFFRDSAALTPALYLRLLKFLYLHARHVETYLSTYFSPNTHLTGEALGLYCLGTLLPEFKRARRWRDLGARILVEQLDRHVLADGVYLERSTYYHRYTADFYTHFLLLARANSDEPLSADVRRQLEEKLTALLDHLMFVTRPDGTTPLVGDDDGGRLAPLDDRAADDFRATLAVGAVAFGRGDYKHVAGDAPESLLWLLGVEGLRDYDALAPREPHAASRAFADGGYYVMRDGWARDSNFMLIDGGAHGASSLNYAHAHADALSFDLAAGGRTLLVDPGTYTYTGSGEWRDHFRTSQAHNTLSIDGASSSVPAGPFRWWHVADARTHAWHTHPRFDYFAGTHDGYARLDGHESYERAVLFLKQDYWIVRDRVRATGSHRYELNFHFVPGAEPRLAADDDASTVGVAADGESVLTLCAFGGAGAWRAEQGWISRCYGARTGASVCRYTGEGEGAQEFVTFALPLPMAAGARARRTSVAGGVGYELRHATHRDVLLSGDGSPASDGRLVSDCEWTWARFDEDGTLAEMVLINGRNCRLDDQAIIESRSPVAFAHAHREGAELVVETDAGIRRRRLNHSYVVIG
ncbi:MAG: alginate lyase family protein [Pyrinomonadaceae bacterium]